MDAPIKTLAEVEREHTEWALAELRGNRTQTAKVLGISKSTLERRLRGYKIRGNRQLDATQNGGVGL